MNTERCKFSKAWIGNCDSYAVEGSAYCAEHAGRMCSGCKTEQATQECDRTGIQFVCGAPLCNNCEGKEDPTAGFGLFGFGGHSHGPR